MSRLEIWIDSVARTLQAGNELATTIHLEGPDGGTWGTWPIEIEKLGTLKNAIREAVEILSEELQAGRHAMKFVASHDGRQLSVLPQTIAGRSTVASSAATEQRAMQQAVSLAVGNFEAMTVGLRQENERLRARNDQLEERLADALETSMAVQQAVAQLTLDTNREQARQQRMTELFETAKPLLEVGLSLIGEHVVKMAEGPPPAKRSHKRKPAEPPTAPNMRGTCLPPATDVHASNHPPDGEPHPGDAGVATDEPRPSARRNKGRASRSSGDGPASHGRRRSQPAPPRTPKPKRKK
jgi:hypothetical protein